MQAATKKRRIDSRFVICTFLFVFDFNGPQRFALRPIWAGFHHFSGICCRLALYRLYSGRYSSPAATAQPTARISSRMVTV